MESLLSHGIVINKILKKVTNDLLKMIRICRTKNLKFKIIPKALAKYSVRDFAFSMTICNAAFARRIFRKQELQFIFEP